MVSKCRRCIFGCFDALPRNIIGWFKIHQLILQKEMPDNFQHLKYLLKFFFFLICLGGLVVECQARYLKVSGSNPPYISMGLDTLR